MKAAVTGATGYIGARLLRCLQDAGHEVTVVGRRPVHGLPFVPFDLEDPAAPDLPAGTDVVFHLAANTSAAALAPGREVEAASALLAATRARGARFVFVSSQTARHDAPTPYGRTKWQVEQAVLADGGSVVRPGQVYGGPALGLFGTLVQAVRGLPLLPDFRPAVAVQPVHVDDLAQALLQAAVRDEFRGQVLRVASPEPVSFSAFLEAIAHWRVGRHLRMVPVPRALVAAAQRLTLGKVAPLQRLASLFDLPAMDTRADLQRLGIACRDLRAGMGGRRHALLAESRALLRYVLGERPSPTLVRRLARALEQLRPHVGPTLPGRVLVQPARLAALDRRGDPDVRWRLDCATAVAEASVQGAARFLPAPGVLRAVVALGAAVVAEGWGRLRRGPRLRAPERLR